MFKKSCVSDILHIKIFILFSKFMGKSPNTSFYNSMKIREKLYKLFRDPI